MSARRLIASGWSWPALCLASSARAEVSGGQGGAGSDSVTSWVFGNGPGRWRTAPAGTTCGPWDQSANLSPQAGAPDLGTVRQDARGRGVDALLPDLREHDAGGLGSSCCRPVISVSWRSTR